MIGRGNGIDLWFLNKDPLSSDWRKKFLSRGKIGITPSVASRNGLESFRVGCLVRLMGSGNKLRSIKEVPRYGGGM